MVAERAHKFPLLTKHVRKTAAGEGALRLGAHHTHPHHAILLQLKSPKAHAHLWVGGRHDGVMREQGYTGGQEAHS